VSQVHVAECPDTQAPELVLYPEDVTPRDLNQAVDHARRLRDLAEASSASLALSVLDLTQHMVNVCHLATGSDHAHRPGRGIQCAQAAMARNKTGTHRVVNCAWLLERRRFVCPAGRGLQCVPATSKRAPLAH